MHGYACFLIRSSKATAAAAPATATAKYKNTKQQKVNSRKSVVSR